MVLVKSSLETNTHAIQLCVCVLCQSRRDIDDAINDNEFINANAELAFNGHERQDVPPISHDSSKMIYKWIGIMRDCVHRDDAKTPARFVVDDRRRLNRTKCYASTQYDRLHDQLADVIEFNLTLYSAPCLCFQFFCFRLHQHSSFGTLPNFIFLEMALSANVEHKQFTNRWIQTIQLIHKPINFSPLGKWVYSVYEMDLINGMCPLVRWQCVCVCASN